MGVGCRSVRMIAITFSHLGVAKSNDDQIWNRLVIRGTKFHSNNTSKQRVTDSEINKKERKKGKYRLVINIALVLSLCCVQAGHLIIILFCSGFS